MLGGDRSQSALLGAAEAAEEVLDSVQAGDIGSHREEVALLETAAEEVAEGRDTGGRSREGFQAGGAGGFGETGRRGELGWGGGQAALFGAATEEVLQVGEARWLGEIAQGGKAGGHGEQAALLEATAEDVLEVRKTRGLREITRARRTRWLGEITHARKTRGHREQAALLGGVLASLSDASGQCESAAHESQDSSTAELHCVGWSKKDKKDDLIKNVGEAAGAPKMNVTRRMRENLVVCLSSQREMQSAL